MCGFYGHGWYNRETGEHLHDFETKNSHGEFELPGCLTFAQRTTARSNAMLIRGEMRKLEGKPWIGINGGKPPEVALWTALKRKSEVLQNRLEPDPQWIPYGINPVNGEVSVQENRGHKQSDIPDKAKETIAATWQLAYPTPESLCVWIRAHFGKRDDFQEWIMGVFGLMDGLESIELLRGMVIGTDEWLDRILKLFCEHPNEYWRDAKNAQKSKMEIGEPEIFKVTFAEMFDKTVDPDDVFIPSDPDYVPPEPPTLSRGEQNGRQDENQEAI